MSAENMLDLRAKPILNRWTTEQRETLCCLYRFFNSGRHDMTRIFNAIFQAEVSQCGFSDGVKFSTLSTQWHDLKRKANPIWLDVHIRTPFSRNGKWSTIIEMIRRTSEQLGIQLSERETDLDVPEFADRFDPTISTMVYQQVIDFIYIYIYSDFFSDQQLCCVAHGDHL